MKKRSNESVEKGLRWVLALFSCASVVLIVALVLILMQTTGDQNMYKPYLNWLLGVNIGITVLLLISLVWAVIRLSIRLKEGRFGSRLLAKLALIFAMVGVLPGLFVYSVSYQFVSKSIEIWFDEKVEGALDAGLKLADVSYEAQAQDLANKVKILSAVFANISDTKARDDLDNIRLQVGVDDVVLSSAEGEVIAASGFSGYGLEKDLLTLSQRAELKKRGTIYGIETSEDGLAPRMWAASVAEPYIYDFTGKRRILRMSAQVPSSLAHNAALVQDAYHEYKERASGRDSLRKMYIGTLTLALFLATFGAIALAVMLGQQLVRPLLILVQGVKQVGEGDLSPKELMDTRDELGGLTHAFAKMTTQLREANELATASMHQVEEARTHLQTILNNLTAGVIELDRDNTIRMINPGAKRILRVALEPGKGQKLRDVSTLKAFSHRIDSCFATLPTDGGRYWQETFELESMHDEEKISIIARGIWLHDLIKLIVLDDISDIISAQRSIAWGEVARRLAHEIKNPLTPIQLSAERMEYKLGNKLEGKDRAVLERSVRMIVDQVDAMKRLVNEFRDYARLPVAKLEAIDLNGLIYDVMQLYVGAQQQHPKLHIELYLADKLPVIQGDAAQLRQVLHNLLQNAIDAVSGKEQQVVYLKTEYQNIGSCDELEGCVCLQVADTGDGFPEKMLKNVFEPYVTTKPHGTGLGLAVVKKIVDEHHARIDISNRTNSEGEILGAQVLLSFPIAAESNA